VAGLDEVELYSTLSRKRLARRAAALVAAVERHTAAVLALPPGSERAPGLCDLNETARAAVAAWDDAVFRCTGTFPVGVDSYDEEDAD
jgi:hypothetical protein